MNDAIPAYADPAAILAALPAGLPPEGDLDTVALLSADHPPWQRDVISISSRTRALLAAIVPVVVRVFTVWDHRWRAIAFGSRLLAVDAAGGYRLR